VDPVTNLLLLRKSDSAGNQTRDLVLHRYTNELEIFNHVSDQNS
jgi:hypothetical protein